MRKVAGVSLVALLALIVPAPIANAEPDPLAEAQAKITEAQRAADAATVEYDAAQAHYYELQREAARTAQKMESLRSEISGLTAIVRKRAVTTYMRGGTTPVDGIFGSAADALDMSRRAVLADRANATSNAAVARLKVANTDLAARERSLRKDLARQSRALDDMRDRQQKVQHAFDDATRAAGALRVRLERDRRVAEYVRLVREAQAAAHRKAIRDASALVTPARDTFASRAPTSQSGSASGGEPGEIMGSGSWVCPVQGAVSFTDTYGAPRSGGRTHKGVDMFAARGTPTVAVVSGSVFFQGDPLGGNAAYVNGNDGNTYYYAHLNDYVGDGRSVAAGEVIGHVGNTGDAYDAPPHLHFEIRLGGPNGVRINPYPTVRAHC